MSVRVGTTGRELTSYGGAELLRETSRTLGVADVLDESLSLEQRARGLSEAEFVLGMVESIACGARCLDDLAVARGDAAQEELRGFPMSAAQTAGAWLRRFTLGRHHLSLRGAVRPRIIEAIRTIGEGFWAPCVDKEVGEVAEFGDRLRDGRTFRRYVVKRIAIEQGEQATLEEGAYRYWVLVTHDHQRPAVDLEFEHRHKALVEAGMRELMSNYGLGTIRRHGFMANWTWLLLVCLAHNIACWNLRRPPHAPTPTETRVAVPRNRHPQPPPPSTPSYRWI